MKRPLHTNQDLFGLAEDTIRIAHSIRDEATAQAIDNALRSSFTPSEVLGDIRSAFAACMPSIDDRYPEDLRSAVGQAIVDIDSAFDRANRAD